MFLKISIIKYNQKIEISPEMLTSCVGTFPLQEKS